MKQRLFTPGPTPVPETIMLRMAAPLPHHRQGEFREIMKRVNGGLQDLFRTTSSVLTLTASGTGGMEGIVANLFSPGESVITVNGGKFGARWGAIARSYGMNVAEISVPWGTAVSPDQVRSTLLSHPGARGVLCTQSETSTGTATDVREIAKIVRESSDALVVVDGISAIGGLEFEMDAWGIDACVTGSQKGMMIPPGLAFVALGPRAIEAAGRSTTPRFYFDFRKGLASHATNDTPWTPAITLIIGVDAALEMIWKEGLQEVWARHRRLATAFRAGAKGIGFDLFSSSPSDSLTALRVPEGVEWKGLNEALKSGSGLIVAGGQGEYQGKIFRVSHLGYYDDLDIAAALAGLEQALEAARDKRRLA